MGLWPQSWPTGRSWHCLRGQRVVSMTHIAGRQCCVFLYNPLPTSLTSGHEPTHRGSKYHFPRFAWPWVLDPEATILCALLTLSLQRAREVVVGGRALSQKWQYLFKVTSYSHAAKSLPANHSKSHGGWLLLRLVGRKQKRQTAAYALLLLCPRRPQVLSRTSYFCAYFL